MRDFASSLQVREGYRVVSGTVDFCVDDILDKLYCVIGDSVNLCTGREGYAQNMNSLLRDCIRIGHSVFPLTKVKPSETNL